MSVNEEILERGRNILQQAPERCRDCQEALDGACEVAKLAVDHFLDCELIAQKFDVVLQAHCSGPQRKARLPISQTLTEVIECGYNRNPAQSAPQAMLIDVIWMLD